MRLLNKEKLDEILLQRDEIHEKNPGLWPDQIQSILETGLWLTIAGSLLYWMVEAIIELS